MDATIAYNTLGLVIAGGKARRMGKPKHDIKLGNRTLLDIAAQKLDLCTDVALNTPIGVEVPGLVNLHEDQVDIIERGPLAAVLLGLEYAVSHGLDAVLTLPVDMPFVRQAILRNLLERYDPGAAIVIHDGDRLQGLVTLWPTGILTDVREILSTEQRLSIHRVHELLESQVMKTQPANDKEFFNVNTIEDLEAAQRLYEQQNTPSENK